MDRIHRIGQYRPILITRLIIENSIESRILQLQEKKQAMVDSTIGKSFVFYFLSLCIFFFECGLMFVGPMVAPWDGFFFFQCFAEL